MAGTDRDLTPLIEQIHANPTKIVMYITGGGVHAPTWLLSVPGASRTVLDVRIPYSHESLADLVKPVLPRDTDIGVIRSTSTEMAMAMANAAFREAASLSEFGAPVLGVGMTCALATDRDRRGEDKAIICTKDSHGQMTVTRVGFEKGQLSRLEQDMVSSSVAINAVAEACGIQASDTTDDASHRIEREFVSQMNTSDESETRRRSIRSLLSGNARTVEFSGACVFLDAPRRNRLYLPGSFNPLHDGHKGMLVAASKHDPGKLGAAFELSVENADKGLLDEEEIARRVAQFIAADLPVVLTRAPLFTTKSDLFPESTFVVGYDTAIRLVQERYYGSEAEMVRQFATLVQRGCSFLVAGRFDATTGTYLSMKDMHVPDVLGAMGMFAGMEEAAFRNDISSTELRTRAKRGETS
jgi:nicotinamide mononucleotide (NMN) deamidase PncC